VSAPQFEAEPLPGEYKLEVGMGEERLEQSFQIAPQPTRLALTTISSVVEGDTPNQIVKATWTAVEGATGYYARVVDGTLGVPVSDDVYTLEPKADLLVGTLNPARAYFVIVVGANMDTVTDHPTLPLELRMSDSIAAVGGMQPSKARVTNRRAVENARAIPSMKTRAP
jgi:hypothetical protein